MTIPEQLYKKIGSNLRLDSDAPKAARQARVQTVKLRKKTMNSSLIVHAAVFALLLGGTACAGGLRDFSSDGCSLFPDGTVKDRKLWCECCFVHDIAYWQGGTKDEKKQADRILRDCVYEKTGNKSLADTMYEAVSLGGQPVFPTWYRWGYGWKYGRAFESLTEQEQQQVRERLGAYYQAHPSEYCGLPIKK